MNRANDDKSINILGTANAVNFFNWCILQSEIMWYGIGLHA